METDNSTSGHPEPLPADPDSSPAPEPQEPVILERALIGFRRLRPQELTRRESRAVWGLCAIYSLGILGLYMVLPVLSPYAHTLRGRTNLLVGMSIGAYGLTQTIFQIPFGHLSDRIGRKRTIFIGLSMFAIGGIVAGLARRIEWLIAGRLLQGAGAVASAVVSLVADITRPGVRTQAMARLGIAIGASFAVGLLAGPFIGHTLGVRTLFFATSVLSWTAGFYLLVAIPAPKRIHVEEHMNATDLLGILRQRRLFLLDGGTYLLHTIVTVLFVVLPFDLASHSGLREIWKIALPAVAVGLTSMVLTARLSDRKDRTSAVLYAGSILLISSCAVFAMVQKNLLGTLCALLFFVLSVSLLEPALPSLMSRFAVGKHRGTAMGIFHMSQFLGTFTGGLLGGAFLERNRTPLFAGLGGLVFLWGLAVSRVGRWRPDQAPPAEGQRVAAP